VGGCGGGAGAQQALFSTNAGKTWKVVDPPSKPFPRLWNLYDVDWKAGVGWYACGAIASIFSTPDNGATWFKSPDPIGPRFELNSYRQACKIP